MNTKKIIKRNKKASISLEMIVCIIIVLILILTTLYISAQKTKHNSCGFISYSIQLEPYKLQCNKLCSDFKDSNRDPARAIAFCTQNYAIDLDNNSNIVGDFYDLGGYGICEEKTYCFALTDCNLGPGQDNRLSPKKCKELMCEYYTNKSGDSVTAGKRVSDLMPLGDCYYDDYLEHIIYWHKNNFDNVTCE